MVGEPLPLRDARDRTLSAAAPRPSRAHVIANVVCFQLCWFACILGAARGMAWLGVLCVAAMAAWHLAIVARAREEAKLLAVVMLVGAPFDSLLAASGWVVFDTGQWAAWLAPYWIVALWGLLALTLNVSMRWLKRRTWLAAALGAVAAPLSYAAGVRLGAARFAEPALALGALALGWAFLMPLVMRLSERFDGVRPRGGHGA